MRTRDDVAAGRRLGLARRVRGGPASSPPGNPGADTGGCPRRCSEQGRYVAEHIDGARYVELPGEDNLFFVGDTGPLLDTIEEFVTGRLPTHDADRILATVMFTDVVSSTEQAAGMGDRRWSELLATHDGLTRAELERFRGREIETTGDGFLATFDGPGRAVRCACAIRDAVRAIDIHVRVGLHTGEIELRSRLSPSRTSTRCTVEAARRLTPSRLQVHHL